MEPEMEQISKATQEIHKNFTSLVTVTLFSEISS